MGRRIIGILERLLLGAAMSVVVFLIECRLNKAIKQREARLAHGRVQKIKGVPMGQDAPI